MKLKFIFLTLFLLIIILTQSYCTKDNLECAPETYNDDNQLHYRNGFILSYNEKHEQANWVFYVLKPSDIICDIVAKRKDNFREDINIKTKSASLDDYKNKGYDRGHLKPSADESCDQIQMDETFLMSNMSPQIAGFNRGVWKNLESYVRNLAKDNDSIYVYTAGTLKTPIKSIGTNNVSVPSHFFKVIYVFNGKNVKIESFFMPNEKTTQKYDDFKVSLDEIEVKTNLKFPKPTSKDRFPKIICN